MNELELKENQESIKETKFEIFLILKTVLILGLISIIIVLFISI